MGAAPERNPSLWMATSEEAAYGPPDGPVQADVAVIGAGITGITTARLLVDEGMSVAVIEAGTVCSGVTGYTTAKVTALHGAIYGTLEKRWSQEVPAVYAAANQASVETVRNLAEKDKIDCDWSSASAYTYATTADGVADVEAEVEAATRAGLPVAFTTETDLPYPVRGAVRLDDQGHFHPRRYCLGLAAAVTEAGGRVFEHTRALALDQDDGTVTTDSHPITAEHVVIASHLPFVHAGMYYGRTEPQRSYAAAFRAEAATDAPQGMYLSIDEPRRSVRPAGDGWIVVGGEGHKVGEDPDTTHRHDALESWTREHFGTGLEYRWSAQDYSSADDLPFMGRLPGTDRCFLATGFAKWGMTNGTVAARIIADLILGRQNAWSATFDSTRVAARQQARQGLKANVEVAKHFVGDRLKNRDAPSADDLAVGSGGIVSRDGETIAAFRDDDGRLHAVSPTCTHMGCQVSFNTAERSWDCPCHGSRFDVDGRLLQGPAVEDLAPKGD